MISFIVTYYNQAEYVRDSLSSILDMAGDLEFEILVGDDGSIDGTTDKVYEFQARYPGRIRMFVMPRDQSVHYRSIDRVSANRINLLSHARGEYYMILDGDDYYCNNLFIADAVAYLDTHPGLVGYSGQYCNLIDGVIEKHNSGMPEGLMRGETFLRRYYIPAGCFLFRNCVRIEDLRGKRFDDNNITVYMLNFGDIYNSRLTMYVYRQHQDSSWNSLTMAEQNLLNAYDMYDNMLLCRSRQLATSVFKRSSRAVKWIWRHRGKASYGNQVMRTDSDALFIRHINTLVNWRNVGFMRRMDTYLYYAKLFVMKRLDME